MFAIPVRLFPNLLFGSEIVSQFFTVMIFLNIVLALFNIIPLFPLDGWSIAYSLLPPEQARWWQRNQQNSYYVFMGLIFLSFVGGQFNILGILIQQPSIQLFLLLIGR